MKNFVFGLLVLLAVIAGVGAYRGWFTMDKAKLQQDEDVAKAEIQHLEQEVKDKTSNLKDPVQERK